MERNKLCCICNKKLRAFERTTTEIIDLLTFILLKVNTKVLQDSLICQTCLSKLEAAHEFKASYSHVTQRRSSSMVKNEPGCSKRIACEICENAVSPNECIPLFDSITETGFSLIKYFSPQLASQMYKDFLSCEPCHKSLINFYDITSLLSIFDQVHINQLNNRDDVNVKEESQQSEVECGANVADNFKTEASDILEDVKEEIERDISEDVKEEIESDISEDVKEEIESDLEDVKEEIECEEVHLKTEESDVLMEPEEENEEIERTGQQKDRRGKINSILLDHINSKGADLYECKNFTFQTQHKGHMLKHENSDAVEMFKCKICTHETKHKNSLKSHMLVHKNSDEVEMFKCQNCTYETKRKGDLKKHNLVHTISNECEVFKCPKCEYKTKKKCNLTRHMVVHEDSNKFTCKDCKYVAKWKQSLKRHMLIHQNSDEVEMFKCQICEYTAKNKYYITDHMYIHKTSDEVETFKCHNCEYKTTFKRI